MLKQLSIQNLVLIEQTEIHFTSGLNIISGETGSGKSAIMNALSLVRGDRVDSNLLRHGCDRGFIEATFDVEGASNVVNLLNQLSLDFEQGEEIVIRRELNASGKNRAFINSQLVPLAALESISDALVDIVGQHANQHLFKIEQHRQLLDTYGNLIHLASKVADNWEQERKLEKELHFLKEQENSRERECHALQLQLDEILEANLREGEEEELFSEYAALSSAEERMNKAFEISDAFSNERIQLFTVLNKQKQLFEQLVRLDPDLEECSKSFETALINLQEVSHTIKQYQSRIEHDPERIEVINERLLLIDKLKKRYGRNFTEIATVKKQLKEKIEHFNTLTINIELLSKQLQELQQINLQLCQLLTDERQKASKLLEDAVEESLHTLNMPKAKFHCQITTESRGKHGQDRIEFFLSPNLGERQIPVKDCVSGGELSRLMLVFQELLAGKSGIPTIIFDEIDANIGGETATIVADKLQHIGKSHQILCITHFPQVAAKADHHLQISKEERENRTVTTVKVLDKKSRKMELARMRGE